MELLRPQGQLLFGTAQHAGVIRLYARIEEAPT